MGSTARPPAHRAGRGSRGGLHGAPERNPRSRAGARVPRGTLSREGIVQASLRLMDRLDLETVTIRAVAEELGASPMALYAHFDSKDALHDAVRNVLVSQIFEGAIGSTWPRHLLALARSILHTLRQHPNWLSLVLRPAGSDPVGVDSIQRLVALMTKDGFTAEQAYDAHLVAASLGLGTAVVERMTRQNTARRAASPRESPEVAQIARLAAGFVGWRADAMLELGMRAFAVALEEEQRPRRTGRRGRRALPPASRNGERRG